MPRSSIYALFLAVSISALVCFSDAQAQVRAVSTGGSQVSASVTIIDGISIGIRKSHQGESELWIEANDLKTTVMTRSEGKLFRERTNKKSEAAIEPTREIAVAFE